MTEGSVAQYGRVYRLGPEIIPGICIQGNPDENTFVYLWNKESPTVVNTMHRDNQIKGDQVLITPNNKGGMGRIIYDSTHPNQKRRRDLITLLKSKGIK